MITCLLIFQAPAAKLQLWDTVMPARLCISAVVFLCFGLCACLLGESQVLCLAASIFAASDVRNPAAQEVVIVINWRRGPNISQQS